MLASIIYLQKQYKANNIVKASVIQTNNIVKTINHATAQYNREPIYAITRDFAKKYSIVVRLLYATKQSRAGVLYFQYLEKLSNYDDSDDNSARTTHQYRV